MVKDRVFYRFVFSVIFCNGEYESNVDLLIVVLSGYFENWKFKFIYSLFWILINVGYVVYINGFYF